MYCTNCGAETKEGANFCIKCGSILRVKEHREEEILNDCTNKNISKKGRYIKWIIASIVVSLLVALFVGIMRLDNRENDDSGDNDFIPDYTEGEKNTYALSSFVIEQGKWIYYYSDSEIMKMDTDGNEYVVFSIRDIEKIAVVGDWIYYATYDEVGKVRTDGTEQSVILEAITQGPFLVDESKLYYIDKYQVGTTTENYSIHCYDIINENEKTFHSEFMNAEYGGRILGMYEDRLYVRSSDGERSFAYCINMSNYKEHKLEIDGFVGGFIHNNQMINTNISGSFNCVTNLYIVDLQMEELIYHSQFEYDKEEGQLINHGGKPFVVCDIYYSKGTEYWVVLIDNSNICLISSEVAKRTLADGVRIERVIEETGINVLGLHMIEEYVYYLGYGQGANRLYRIKVDGTDWSQLY